MIEDKQKDLPKRYGLIWDGEREPEEVVLNCNKAIPILEEAKDKEVKGVQTKLGVSPTNVLVEGDNYHGLSVLNYTHKGRIDVVYIDPPYNTGAKDWKYNNNYVDINDQWRHSKWLNMMSKRLHLAKNLLKEDGVLICAIDENEFHHLGCSKALKEMQRGMNEPDIKIRLTACKMFMDSVEKYTNFLRDIGKLDGLAMENRKADGVEKLSIDTLRSYVLEAERMVKQ